MTFFGRECLEQVAQAARARKEVCLDESQPQPPPRSPGSDEDAAAQRAWL